MTCVDGGKLTWRVPILIAGLVASCSEATGPDPILLEVVAGDGQEAQV